MENQHRKITGYRDLSQEEIDLINEIKAAGERLDALCTRVSEHVIKQPAGSDEAVAARHRIAQPWYWATEGRTELQRGVMFLTRAVAQPTSF